MDILLAYIVPVIAVLAFSLIMSRIYKDKEKKDKGFVLNFYNLTYRRRFIRALWGIPLIIFLYIAMYWFSELTSKEYIVIGIIFLILISWDITYNYVKWKKNEEEV